MDDYQRFLNKALRFLSYRSRSEKEVKDYLQKKQAPHEIKQAILDFLKERRFVNDEDFATNWIEQRLRIKHKAFRVIEMELKQKGVSKTIIEQAILNSQLSPLNFEGDLETARKFVQKKLSQYKELSKQEIYRKMGGFLGRKGFEWETIKKAIDSEIKERS